MRDREKKKKVREKKNNLLYIRRLQCNGGYFALQNTRSTPVPTSPLALASLVIPAMPSENNIYLSPAGGRKKDKSRERIEEREIETVVANIRVVSSRRKRNFQRILTFEIEIISCLMIINTTVINIVKELILVYAYYTITIRLSSKWSICALQKRDLIHYNVTMWILSIGLRNETNASR